MLDQFTQLLACGNMACRETPEMRLVEHGEAGWEQFPVNDPFAQARDHSETDPLGQFGQGRYYSLHIMGFDMLCPIAQDHPVNGRSIRLGPCFSRLPDQFGVEAQFLDLECFWIDLSDEIEIDKTVVNRSHQCMGASGDKTRELVIASWRIIEQKINSLAHLIDQLLESGERIIFENIIERLRHFNIQPFHRRVAIFKISIGRALAGIEINDCNLMPLIGEGYGNMHRGGRFTRTTFFIGEHDMVCTVCHDYGDTPFLDSCDGQCVAA